MKIKWNRLNRGIILAVILTVGVAAHVKVQDMRFEKNIPEIEDKAEQLCREMVESNIGSGEAARRKQRAFVQNNFEESKLSMMDRMGVSFVMNKANLTYELNWPSEGDGEVLDASYKQIDADVTRYGTTGANVDVNYEIVFECMGTPSVLCFAGVDETEYSVYDDSDEKKAGLKTITLKGKVSMYMQPDGDDWKMITFSMEDWYRTNVDYPEETDADIKNDADSSNENAGDEPAAETGDGSSIAETDDVKTDSDGGETDE